MALKRSAQAATGEADRRRPAHEPLPDPIAEDAEVGRRWIFYLRLAVIGVVALFVVLDANWPAGIFPLVLLAALVVTGWLPLVFAGQGRGAVAMRYGLTIADSALVTAAILLPNPWENQWVQMAVQLHGSEHAFLYLLIVAAAFSYSPRVTTIAGASAALAWLIGGVWIASSVGMTGPMAYREWLELSPEARAAVADPRLRVDLVVLLGQAGLLAFTGLVLGFGLYRARRLMDRLIHRERVHAALDNHYRPELVVELARMREPFARPRALNAAVLVVSCPGLARSLIEMPADGAFADLRRFHRLVMDAVFDANGAVNRSETDAVVATFGTPRSGPEDVPNAVDTATAVMQAAAEWNAERRHLGAPTLDFRLVLHHGPVTFGNAGDATRWRLASFGRAVEEAGELVQVASTLDAYLLVSRRFMDLLEAKAPGARRRLGQLEEIPPPAGPRSGRGGIPVAAYVPRPPDPSFAGIDVGRVPQPTRPVSPLQPVDSRGARDDEEPSPER
ncbi:adenylate/guanylate cyclase domain-containing protein [Marinibaculum pumilum]|uniref:Adenylate/guanylate cyclase domain-containing protein n=1 Tax=Marinibaculum pumilum TaxID=1766165 RepID=A0ABV7KVY8_9PROT